MARKREDHTPTIRAKAPSGWCIDKLHTDCKGTFTYSDCNCACHDAPVPAPVPKRRGRPPKVAPEVTQDVSQDPRPWVRNKEK